MLLWPLLLLRSDGGRRIALLLAVIVQPGVVAALNLYNVFRVADVVLHALVEGTAVGQGIFIRIIAIDVGPIRVSPSTWRGWSEENLDAMAPPSECRLCKRVRIPL